MYEVNPSFNMVDSGTPYDWEQPDAYRVPEFEQSSVPEPRKSSFMRQTWSVIGITVLAAGGLRYCSDAIYNKGFSDAQHALAGAAPNPETAGCPKVASTLDTIPNIDQNIDIIRSRVHYAGWDFESASTDARIEATQNFDEIESIMNEIFNVYGISVSVGKLPKQETSPDKTNALRITHVPENLTLSQAQHAAEGILDGLSGLTVSLLGKTSGLHIYLSQDIRDDGHGVGGLYVPATSKSHPAILLNAYDRDVMSENFDHEFAHALNWAICGNTIANNDTEYAGLNPPDFSYTRNPSAQGTAVANQITVSTYAGTNAAEDAAEEGRYLFEYGLDCESPEDTSVVCEKSKLLVERQATVDPNIAAVYEYRAEAGGKLSGYGYPNH